MIDRLMRHRTTNTIALTLLLALGTSLNAQSASDLRVVRRADRRALVLLLPLPLADYKRPVNTSRFILLDRADKSLLPLEGESDVSEQGCARQGSARMRVCVVLAKGAPALIDSHAYILVLDSIALKSASGPLSIGANSSLQLEPVTAQLRPIAKPPTKVIEVTYDLDALGDSTLALELYEAGKRIEIPESANRKPGQPLCYNVNTLSFRCTFDQGIRLHSGEEISAKFSRSAPSDLPSPTVTIKPVTYTNKTSVGLSEQSSCSICISGGYSQTTRSKTATFQATWHNTPFALRTIIEHDDGFGYEGSLSPYLDLSVSTDASTKGYINPGVQYSGLMYWDQNTHFLRALIATLTPRAELDKSATVLNFIPLDFVLNPGLGGLTSHEIFLHGLVQVWPSAGFEKGWTIRGRDVSRDESNDPSRFKGGVSVIAKWFGPAKPTGFCKTFGCAEFDLQAGWQHYKL
ncbi:MAG: hypothetical protein ABI884_10495, partial [Gemmatimonadota bacterium]